MKNYAEIFGNIMRKKVTIMPKRRQIIQKFLKINYRKLFPWLFQTKYMLQFNSFMTSLTVDRYFFVQSSFSIVFSPKLSNQALNRTRKTGYQKSDN